MNDDRWRSLCRALNCEDEAGLSTVVVAAEELRAELDIRGETLRVTAEEASAMVKVVEAAAAWYSELLRLGHYKPGEVRNFSSLRSDRWPYEVDLAAATDTYLSITKRSLASDEESLLK